MRLPFNFRTLLFIAATLGTFSLPTSARRSTKAADAVHLSNIQTLTFYNGRMTTARRVSAIPQLECSGPACRFYHPDTIRCRASGSSYSGADVEWTCNANLPPEFKLGATEVVCEGYDSPEDEYILKGSCGLEYRLLLTGLGEEKYGRHSPMDWNFGWGREKSDGRLGASIFDILFGLLFVGVAATILWSFFSQCLASSRRRNTPRRTHGGPSNSGGGNDDNDDDDPPPPYTPKRQKRPTNPGWSSYMPGFRGPRTYGTNYGPSTANTNRGGWWGEPGFWTGAATGAAAGYFAGSRQNRPNASTAYGMRDGFQRGTGGWFGGGARDPGEGPSGFGRTSRGSFGGGHSTERYESTGFGGTRRR